MVVLTEAQLFTTEFTKLNNDNDAWYADNAATEHMTSHKEWFTNYHPFVAQTQGVQVAK